MGRFLNRFTGENQLLFPESKLFYHGIQYPKNTPRPSWEVRQIMKIALYSVKALITLTCRNSLISLVINKFYFGILEGLQMKQTLKF